MCEQGGHIMNILQVVEDAQLLTWHLVGTHEQFSPTEALVFTIQAIIRKKMLPPVLDNKR
jgi:hypothetical protein